MTPQTAAALRALIAKWNEAPQFPEHMRWHAGYRQCLENCAHELAAVLTQEEGQQHPFFKINDAAAEPRDAIDACIASVDRAIAEDEPQAAEGAGTGDKSCRYCGHGDIRLTDAGDVCAACGRLQFGWRQGKRPDSIKAIAEEMVECWKAVRQGDGEFTLEAVDEWAHRIMCFANHTTAAAAVPEGGDADSVLNPENVRFLYRFIGDDDASKMFPLPHRTIRLLCQAYLARVTEARKPDGYAYRYETYDGQVIRFNGGIEVNGGKPIEAIPYYFGTPPAAQAQDAGPK